MKNRLENKVAIITGGSGGIGLAIAKQLVKKNVKVYDISKNMQPHEEYVKSFEGDVNNTTQIDNILKLLNDAAEYRSSESNIKLQWIMMVITILSLIVALCSINNSAVINEIIAVLCAIRSQDYGAYHLVFHPVSLRSDSLFLFHMSDSFDSARCAGLST